jgi:hypothetical protein
MTNLITIIRTLAMHHIHGLIKLKSRYRKFDFILIQNLNDLVRNSKFGTSNSFPSVELVTKCKYKSLVQVSSQFEDSKKKF